MTGERTASRAEQAPARAGAGDAPSLPAGKRAERTRQTRESIVTAARELFVARGYRAVSLRDIAVAAGVSHPGLMRHFATKDLLLAEVVAQLETDGESLVLERAEGEEPGALAYAAVAERNASIPGYLPLFAALTGEASATSHPAHERMRDRYGMLRELSADVLEEAIIHGVVAEDRDPRGEATRLAAAWDGLQLIEQYLPDRVDVVEALRVHESLLSHPRGWRDPGEDPPSPVPSPIPPMPDLGDVAPVDAAGYQVGRERRARIISDATALFALEGYSDTSLRDIAERVGVSKSTLLHHYGSKEALLGAVLAERDRSMRIRTGEHRELRVADELRMLPAGAARNADAEPGLIEVYAVLSCEAVPEDHPAHAYFEVRFARALEHFTALFETAQRDGDLPAHRDPRHEAAWLTALWDGLQYQWLYDRDAVDIADHLAAHLEDVLPTR